MDKKKDIKMPDFSLFPTKRLKKNRDIKAFTLGMNIVINFAIIMAVSLFITVNLGLFLDEKVGTGFLFTFFGAILGIFSSFRVLFDQIKILDREEGEDEH